MGGYAGGLRGHVGDGKDINWGWGMRGPLREQAA